jgi:hypothetical protein
MNSSELVRELLSYAGIPAGEEEIAVLAEWFPAAHSAAAGLRSVPVGTGLPAAMPSPPPAAPDLAAGQNEF